MPSSSTWNPDLWLNAGGQLPDGWNLVPFGDLLDGPKAIAVGVMYPGKDTPGGVPLVRVGDVVNGTVPQAPTMCISQEVHHEYSRTVLSGNELLITLVGSPGACVVVTPAMKGWNVARALAVANLKKPELRDYLKAVFASPPMKSIILSMLNTTVQPTLNLKEIKQLPVPIPTDNEVSQIGYIMATFDRRLELLQQTNATLETVAQAIFKSWFVDFDPVRARAEGREPEGMDAETAALFPSEFEESELGLIPKGWRVDEVGNVAHCVGGATPSTKEPKYWNPAEHRWATPKDLSGLPSHALLATGKGVSRSGLKKISSGLLPAGTLLLSSRAPIGYLAIAYLPVAINQGFIAMLPGGALPPEYLLFWTKLNMDLIKQKANGSTFMEISKAAFRPIKLVVPPQPVVDAFLAITKPTLDKVALNADHARVLSEVRDELLPRLISGKLRVPEAQRELEAVLA